MKNLLFILFVAALVPSGFGQNVPSDTLPIFMFSEMVSGSNWYKKALIYDEEGNRIWLKKNADSCCVVLINYKDTLIAPNYQGQALEKEMMKPVLSRVAMDTILLSTYKKVEDYCGVFDTLTFARRKHPGQRNSLDALCSRYHVDNSNRELHGALLDAELLAQVYLLLTGGQGQLFQGGSEAQSSAASSAQIKRISTDRKPLKVIHADQQEISQHEEFMGGIS